MYEIEVTNENAEDLARAIKEEESQENVQQTPPTTFDSPPRTSVFDRIGLEEHEESHRRTPVRDRLGQTNSEAKRNRPVKDRIGVKPSCLQGKQR